MANENTKMTADLSEKADQDTSILNEDVKKSLSDELISFLEKCRVEKGQVFTHTSFAKNLKGVFYMCPDKEDAFHDLYKRCYEEGMVLGMIEKPRDIMPLLVDLDFKQSTMERRYDMSDVCNFIDCYNTILRKYVELSDKPITYYILEKPQPKKHGQGYKDGLHIVCPSVVVRPHIQQFVREEMLNGWDTYAFGKKWMENFSNDKKDIYDEAVLGRNGWFMYGSHKATEEHPWKVSFTYNTKVEMGFATRRTYDENEDLVDVLSIRNKYRESELTEYGQGRLDAYIQEQRARQAFIVKNITTYNGKQNSNDDDLEQAKLLVAMLSGQRANDYLLWLKVGLCLRNIDYRLLEQWIEFSKKSNKYKEGECDKLWNTFTERANGLKIGSLHMWAKTDSRMEYENYKQETLEKYIRSAVGGTEYDVAVVFSKMYPKEIVYDTDTGNWYRYNGVHWKQDPNAISIRKQIPVELANKFREWIKVFATRANDADVEQDEKDHNDELMKKLAKVVTQLKRASFQNNVVTECQLIYGKEGFEEKLNETRHLLGFENGVYDLDEGVFREGEYDDLISITTGYDYQAQSNPHIRNRLMEFFKSIMPNDLMVVYLLMIIATCLHGSKKDHSIYFWIGKGGNGKGVLNVLLSLMLGAYYYPLPIEWYVNKRANASAANPETLKMKGTRLMLSTEPENDDTIRVGKMKQLTGGDKIEARALYGKFISFQSQGLNIIQMNEKPVLSGTDGGVKRRLRVIRFPFNFVENPVLNHERKTIKGLEEEFKDILEYRQELMLMLIEKYAEYKKAGYIIPVPEEVQRETNDYLDANNHLKLFIDEYYENDAEGIVLWDNFIQDFKMKNQKLKKSKNDIKREMEDMGYEVKKNKMARYRDRVCIFGLKQKASWMGDEPDDYD